MKQLLRPFASSLLILLLAAIVGSSAQAQWTAVLPTPFPAGTIHIVKFLDRFGAPNTGVLGDTNTLWYTTTGGTTAADWSQATITGANPSGIPFFRGWVNDISFKDPLDGAAIITGNLNPLDSGVLITHDGGQTWAFDDHAGTPDSGSGIYWNPANGYLFVSSLDKGLVYSSDGGTTWHGIDTDPDTGTHYTGFAFSDGNRGVVATSGSNQNGYSPSYHWLQTTDGGLTWHRTLMYWECWQPLAIPTTETYFASTDFYSGSTQPTAMLLRSDNSGYSFGQIPSFSGVGDTLTEDVTGDGCDLFAPTAPSILGMFYSTNDGNFWQTINGAPAPAIDTRVFASSTAVWSFTGNKLYYAARPASNPIHIYPKDSIAFTKASCGNTSDSVIHIIGCVCSNLDTLIRTDTGKQTGGKFTSNTTQWPRALCPSPSPLYNPDSVHADTVQIQYSPSGVNPDVGVDTIWYDENGTKKDTVIKLWGNGVTPGLSIIYNGVVITKPLQIELKEPACADTTISFEIVNTSCSAVRLLHSYLAEADTDTSVLSFNLPTLPTTLNPGDRVEVGVSFQGKLVKSGTSGSVYFDWQGGTQTGNTVSITVVGLTSTSTHPEFRGLNFSAASCCNVPEDTTIYFVNSTSCTDTLLLYTPQFCYESDPGLFSLDSNKMFGKGPHFPIKVPPNAFIPLPIRICGCHAGDFKDSICFRYSFGPSASGPQTVFGQWDTVMHMHVGQTGDIEPTISTNSVKWFASSCDTAWQYKTITITAGCKPDTLTKAQLTTLRGQLSADSVSIPTILQPGQQIKLRVGYLPPDTGIGSLSFSFFNECLQPPTQSYVVQLNGTATSSATLPLSSNSIDFGTISCDSSVCDTVWMKGSCSPAKISAITPSPMRAPFSFSGVSVGTTLNKGDNTPIIVCMSPTPYGTFTDSITFTVADAASGTVGIPDVLTLTGTITPPSPSFTLTQLAGGTVRECDTMDEQFTLTNTGSCYTYVITGASATDGGKVTTTPVPGGYPVRIAPGGSHTFNVHFDPQNTLANLTGSITLTDSGGQTVQVPYSITVTPCATTDTFIFSMQDSVINTPNCINGTTQFTASSGGSGGTVTSVVLTGSPQFSTPSAAGSTLPYTGTVTFDPNVAGNNAATLTITVRINGKTFTKTVQLTGVTVGTKFTTRIGLESPTNGCIRPNDTDLEQFNVVLGDTLWDSLNVNQLHFLIHYDGDLLWNPKFLHLAQGWSVASEYEDTMGLHITLTYNGSGQGYTAAGDTILTVTQLGAVAKSLSTTAFMDSTHFNDSAYEACIMKATPLSSADQVPVCITIACPQNIIQDGLTGALQSTPIDKLSIVPNPIRQDGTSATLNFHTTVAGSATVEVVNELGNPVSELINGPVIKGDHIVPILTNNLAQGAYFVRITMNGYTVVRKFVLEKE